jgi:type I restriction enzyme S subunit
MRADGWKKVMLGNIAQFSRERISHEKLNIDNYVSTENMLPYKGGKTIASSLPKGNAIKFIAGQTLVSNIRPYFKKIWFATMEGGASADVLVFRTSKEIEDKYFYYLLNQDHFFHFMVAGSKGTKMPRGDKQQIMMYPVELPPLSEQKAIAATLSCLDDKIELNNRINKNLEEIAQAIFKSWFVDFEPFQDGEFEDSELGRIPKGWRVGTIGELIAATLGGDWGKEVPQGNYSEEVICIRGADIPEIASGKKGKPPIRYILKKNLEKKRLSAGQIIIEISGGSTNQSTGRTALITHEQVNFTEKPLICTNFCRALSMKNEYYPPFVYSVLRYLYSKDVFFSYENGTTSIKNLDTNNLFGKHSIVLPDDDTMIRYKEIFDTLINTIYQNGAEVDKLEVIRDTLLPHLMSGEIRVPIKEVQ